MTSAFVAICVFVGALSAEANMQSDRWFYDISNDGRDVHFMIQLIEEDPPNFDTTFKLTRNVDAVLFEHRQFVKEEADEVFGPGCVEDWSEAGYFNADCDSDGTDDCAGTCGTAYRYDIVDECVPDSAADYKLFDETTGEQVGTYVFEFGPDPDDSCLDSGGTGDSGCSVAAVPESTSEAGLAALMLLVGLGFVVVARRI
jgi:MYXO-CTERM domain-containing protein